MRRNLPIPTLLPFPSDPFRSTAWKFDSASISLSGSAAPYAEYTSSSGIYTVHLSAPAAVGTHKVTLTKAGYLDAEVTADYCGSIAKVPAADDITSASAISAAVSGKTITFSGTIPFVYSVSSKWRHTTSSAHFAGVRVTAPAGMDDVTSTAILITPEGTAMPEDEWMNGNDFGDIYIPLNQAGESYTFYVKWQGTSDKKDSFTVCASSGLTMQGADKVGNTRAQATVLNLSTGGAVYTDYLFPNADQDWYRFTVTESGAYDIRTTNTYPKSDNNLDTYLFLFDDSDHMLAYDDDSGTDADNPNASYILYSLTPGTYYIEVVEYAFNDIKDQDPMLPYQFECGLYDISVKPLTTALSDTPVVTTSPIEPGDGTVIEGTSAAEAQITIYIDGQRSTTTADVTGAWAFTEDLHGGEHLAITALETAKAPSLPVIKDIPNTATVTALTGTTMSITSGSIVFDFDVFTTEAGIGTPGISFSDAYKAPYYLDPESSIITFEKLTTSGAITDSLEISLYDLGLSGIDGETSYANIADMASDIALYFIPDVVVIDLVGGTEANSGADQWQISQTVTLTSGEHGVFDSQNIAAAKAMLTDYEDDIADQMSVYENRYRFDEFDAAYTAAELLPEDTIGEILIRMGAVKRAADLIEVEDPK